MTSVSNIEEAALDRPVRTFASSAGAVLRHAELMTSAESGSSGFHPLTARQCEDLLASQRAGRVAWNAADGPLVLPVTYRMYTGEVVFRTSPYGVLSQLVEPTNVAFEIDEVDQESGVGWSVGVRGRARAVTHADDLAKLWVMDGLVPWATGTRNLFVGITPHSIRGRAVEAPFAD